MVTDLIAMIHDHDGGLKFVKKTVAWEEFQTGA